MRSTNEIRSSNPAWRGAGFATADPGQPSGVTIASSNARMTMEDVIMHTVGLFLLAAVGAGFGWVLVGSKPGAVMAAGLGAFALSMVVGFSRVTRPALIIAFGLIEGVFLGGISRYYHEVSGRGIVAQALIGTSAIFLIMLFLHRSGRLRATPRMTKIVTSVLIGVVVLSVVNFAMLSFGGGGISIFDPQNASLFSIGFSVAILVVASLMFTLDFAYIESAIEAGVERKEAWRAAYGLLVAFVWVYLELLRLLSKLQNR